MSGTILAQALPLLLSPLLARLYTPHEFGVWAIFFSIINILGYISTFRYELAIVLPEKREDAKALLAGSGYIAAGLAVLSLVIILISRNLIAGLTGSREIIPWLYFVPLGVFLSGIYQSLNYYSIRQKSFKRNAIARAALSISSILVNIIIGLLVTNSSGLYLGTLAGLFCGVLFLAGTKIFVIPSYLKQIPLGSIKANFRKYRKFFYINTPHALIDVFQDNGIFFVITYFFQSTVLGFYSFAFRVTKAPASIISASFSQVFYEKASRISHDPVQVRKAMVAIHKTCFLFGLPFFLLLFLFTPDIFSLVFSEEYREAGVISQILVPWLFLNFIAGSTSGVPLIYNRLVEALIFTITDILLKAASLIIGGLHNDYKLAFLLMSISCSILTIITFVWVYSITKQPVKTSR